MNLEDQVCSLELAKKLKELGVKQESLFYWIKDMEWKLTANLTWQDALYLKHMYLDVFPIEIYSAFTIGELGKMLPGMIKISNESFFISLDCDKNVYYEDMQRANEIHLIDKDDETEANSRAITLVYLIENKIIGV